MKSYKYQLVAWHEERIRELQYPHAVAWELRQSCYDFVARWIGELPEVGAHGWPQTNSATLRGAPAIG